MRSALVEVWEDPRPRCVCKRLQRRVVLSILRCQLSLLEAGKTLRWRSLRGRPVGLHRDEHRVRVHLRREVEHCLTLRLHEVRGKWAHQLAFDAVIRSCCEVLRWVWRVADNRIERGAHVYMLLETKVGSWLVGVRQRVLRRKHHATKSAEGIHISIRSIVHVVMRLLVHAVGRKSVGVVRCRRQFQGRHGLDRWGEVRRTKILSLQTHDVGEHMR